MKLASILKFFHPKLLLPVKKNQPGHVVTKHELQSRCMAEILAASSSWLLTISRFQSHFQVIR
jgi:hypothetical protein